MSTPYYKLADLILILFSSIFAYWLRFGEFQLPLDYILPTSIFCLSAGYSLSAFNFYGETNSGLSKKIVASSLSSLLTSALLTTSFLYFTKTGETYSRVWFMLLVITSMSSILLIRGLLGHFFIISSGSRNVVVIGNNQSARKTIDTLKSDAAKSLGIQLVGQISSESATESLDSLTERALRMIRELPANTSKAHAIFEIWITSDVFGLYPKADIEISLSDASTQLVYIPELPDTDRLIKKSIDSVLGIPILNSSFNKSYKLNSLLKYIEDKAVACTLTILISPLLLLIAIAIKLDSKGPVIFKQARHGFGGREFFVYKFRTMIAQSEPTAFRQATKDDNRITRVGKLLRRTSLDELPQLFNVLEGSMSLVGPRPHPVALNDEYRLKIARYMMRHSIKPGITGLAQVNGFRGETSTIEAMQGRIRYDLEYVGNWSVLLDIKILGLTALHLFTTDQAY